MLILGINRLKNSQNRGQESRKAGYIQKRNYYVYSYIFLYLCEPPAFLLSALKEKKTQERYRLNTL